MNIIAQLAYYDVAVQHVSHYATGTFLGSSYNSNESNSDSRQFIESDGGSGSNDCLGGADEIFCWYDFDSMEEPWGKEIFSRNDVLFYNNE